MMECIVDKVYEKDVGWVEKKIVRVMVFDGRGKMVYREWVWDDGLMLKVKGKRRKKN